MWKNGMKLTNEEFKLKLHYIYNGEYTVFDTYINSTTKLKTKHNKCNYEYFARPSDLLQGYGCPKCGGTMKKTDEEFKKNIFELVGNEYIFIEKYVNAKTPILVKHINCGYEYKVSPNNFKNGKRCPKCLKLYRRTPLEFLEEVKKLTNNEYMVMSEFKRTHIKVRFKHTLCEYEFDMTPEHFIKGNRCPFCAIKKNSEKRRLTTSYFKQKVHELHGDMYSVLGEYKDSRTKIKMKHNECGYEWEVIPTLFTSHGTGCPSCKESKGERRIRYWLTLNEFKFIREYRFLNCRGKRTLPFDFAIFEKDTCIAIIEFDGEQHFKPKFNQIEFKRTQRNDKIKNKFCKDHNIKLIRISFKEYDKIEEILETELSCYQLKII